MTIQLLFDLKVMVLFSLTTLFISRVYFQMLGLALQTFTDDLVLPAIISGTQFCPG